MNSPIAAGVTVRRAAAADEPVLSRMLELYQHDLSDIWDQDLDAQGRYGYQLAKFWTDPSCMAVLFLVGGHYAGFALVDGLTRRSTNQLWMSQFFVLKKYRRLGIGASAACRVFDQLRGRWEVGQMEGNDAARTFWRVTISRYAAGNFSEEAFADQHWRGTLMSFDNSSNDRSGIPPPG